MRDKLDLLREIRRDLNDGPGAHDIETLAERLNQLSIGLTQKMPVVFRDSRFFRVRRMDQQPSNVSAVGAPPPEMAPIGRLNQSGQSVLYVADSPDTAFAESRAASGTFCLSEWRVNVEKLGMANGGISPAMLAEWFPKLLDDGHNALVPKATELDDEILALFREIYRLDVGDNRSLYCWSISCSLANGFAHQLERNASGIRNGITKWNGRYPFGAIAYPSLRADRPSLNYALNDHGQTCVRLNHVQWIRRTDNGSYAGLNYSNSWDYVGTIHWENRAARFELRPGERAKLTKVAHDTWLYETADGSIPWFS